MPFFEEKSAIYSFIPLYTEFYQEIERFLKIVDIDFSLQG